MEEVALARGSALQERMLKAFLFVLAGAALSGCSVLSAFDYDGNPKKAFEIRAGWDHGIETSKAKPGGVDENGVYQPETKGVDAILSFPSVGVGIAGEIAPDPRMTPVVTLEAFRFKTPIPYARWWVVQVGGGAQIAEVYLGKLIVPVVDITAGPWYGWDFEERRGAWGLQATIFRF